MKKILSAFIISLLVSGTALAASTGSGGTPKGTGSETTGTISTTPQNKDVEDVKDVKENSPTNPPRLTTPTPSPKHCGNKATLLERITCRLNADEPTIQLEVDTAYFPEGCRRGTKDWQDACKIRYKAVGPCWDEDKLSVDNYDGDLVMGCIKEKLKLPKTLTPVADYCQGKDKGCAEEYKKAVYHLIIARFYDAEERAEILLDAGKITKAQGIDFIVFISQSKLDFYDAKTKDERLQIINNVISKWQQLTQSL